MKWLIVPEDITLVDELTDSPLKDDKGEIQKQSFVEFMLTFPMRDPEYFGKGLTVLDARNDLRDSLLKYRPADGGPPRRARAGDCLGIENTTHEILLKWLDKPSNAFFPQNGGQLTPFMHAIKSVKDRREDLLPAA